MPLIVLITLKSERYQGLFLLMSLMSPPKSRPVLVSPDSSLQKTKQNYIQAKKPGVAQKRTKKALFWENAFFRLTHYKLLESLVVNVVTT